MAKKSSGRQGRVQFPRLCFCVDEAVERNERNSTMMIILLSCSSMKSVKSALIAELICPKAKNCAASNAKRLITATEIAKSLTGRLDIRRIA